MDVKFRGGFAYVAGRLPDDETLPLMRLRYGSHAASWGFAIHLASKNGYEPAAYPTDNWRACPKNALDCARGLYLGDPTAWT